MGAKQTALITGGSSGIGYELAKLFAKNGYDLVLVARSEKQLTEAANSLKNQAKVVTIVQDLSVPGSPNVLYAELQRQAVTVDVLVNNAGFATYGYFTEIELNTELQMMQVNMVTLTHLTKLLLPGMKARHNGKILNVASNAAFQPGPLMAIYYASKAYVLSFSEALSVEMKGTGVTVTALCPGPTESGFQARAAMTESKLVQSGLMSAADVAKIGYDALMAGRDMTVTGFKNQVFAVMARFVPRRTAAQMAMNMQQRVAH